MSHSAAHWLDALRGLETVLDAGAPLEAGQRVKVPIPQPHAPRQAAQ